MGLAYRGVREVEGKCYIVDGADYLEWHIKNGSSKWVQMVKRTNVGGLPVCTVINMTPAFSNGR